MREGVATASVAPSVPQPYATAPAQPAQPSIHSDVDEPKYNVAENADNYAIVIGVENYTSLPAAQFAERDAEAVRKHLVAMGYPQRNIVFLVGAHASRAGFAKNIETWLPNNVNERSKVFIYYSGHGSPNPETGKGYLLPVDGDPQYLEDTAYPIARLYEKLNSLNVKQVFVAIDACFSGAGGRSVLAKGIRPLVVSVDIGNFVSGKIVSLSASAANQITGTIESQGHGLFTYYLLKGLNGAAMGTGNNITVKSLYDYIVPNVQDEARRSNRDQTPNIMPKNLGEKAALTIR